MQHQNKAIKHNMDTYEKKYKEALERAKLSRLQLLDIGEEATEIEYIFPELKENENEDERIRKELLEHCKNQSKPYIQTGNKCPQIQSWIAWLEKQGQVKEYTFKSIPRLLEMVEQSDRAVAYCQKLIDTLINEGYAVDAKIVCKCLKKMCGEKVALATMDDQKINKSDDERIRKELIDFLWKEKIFLQDVHSSVENNPKYRFIMDAIAWLEKQNHDGKKWIYEDVYLKEKEQLIQDGIEEVLENPQKYGLEKQCEQKSADKVEPKFKVGDWILYSGDHYDGVRHITKIDEKGYYIERNGFPHGIIPFNHEIFMRLWTIQYAKDGDVLAVDSMPFIYNGAKNEVTVGAYCGFNAKHKFSFAYNYVINQNITPATREQRDALMKAITDAGYEWDSEKKELNKIETPEESLCISTEEYNKVVNECVFGAENKSRWTEEDEKNFLGVIDEIKANKSNAPDYDLETYDRFLSWLESIKHRIS